MVKFMKIHTLAELKGPIRYQREEICSPQGIQN